MLTALRIMLVIALVLTVAGLSVSSLLVVDAKKDLAVIMREKIQDGRTIVARSSFITECFRLFNLAMILIWAAASTAVLWDIPQITRKWMVLTAVGAMTATVLGVTSQSLLVYATRRKLFDAYRIKYEETHRKLDEIANGDS